MTRTSRSLPPRTATILLTLAITALGGICGAVSSSQERSEASNPPGYSSSDARESRAQRDGQDDFDWEHGDWRTHVRRLERPLTGSTNWVEYEGTSIVREVWDGRANLVELDVEGPSGRIEGLSLRLYNPSTGQWSLNFASSRTGALSPPTIGGFEDGRGEFYGHETIEGRPVLVRFLIWCESDDVCHFEQAFSSDGGQTWEVNWIARDTRIADL